MFSQERRSSLDREWRGDSAFSPAASITIHYYSALPVCKCFLTTRDSQPARFPHSPSAETDGPAETVNARVRKKKKAHRRNTTFLHLTCHGCMPIISKFISKKKNTSIRHHKMFKSQLHGWSRPRRDTSSTVGILQPVSVCLKRQTDSFFLKAKMKLFSFHSNNQRKLLWITPFFFKGIYHHTHTYRWHLCCSSYVGNKTHNVYSKGCYAEYIERGTLLTTYNLHTIIRINHP